MPERQHKLYSVIPSEAVQGEGSYVKIRAITWGDSKILAKFRTNRDDPAVMEALSGIFERLIVEWNWVDDYGNPLPLPSEAPGMLDGLPVEEFAFIQNAIRFDSRPDTKN